MRLTLSLKPCATDKIEAEHRHWVLLPGLCCEAAGGDPSWAEPVAAAWGLLYTAAHVLDSVEDNDIPDAMWAHLGPGPAVNVATGLIVSASLALSGLRCWDVAETVVASIMDDFYCSILQICSGQHRDLTQAEPSLEECWQVVDAKSGTVFAVACRAGARLVIDDQDCLGHYSRFGHHLGVLVQIGDDASGVWPTKGRPSDLATGGGWTLPVAYAMAVSPPEVRVRLRECLQAASQDPAAEVEGRRLMENAGAALYLAAEAERYCQRAKLALENACPPSAARDELASLLDSITLLHSG